MRNNTIDMASLVLQVYNLVLLMNDFNNADLMQELKTIIEQNTQILNILNERSENNGGKLNN